MRAKVAVILHLDEKIYPLPMPLDSALFRNIILTSVITKRGNGKLSLYSTVENAGVPTCKTGMWCTFKLHSNRNCSKKDANRSVVGNKNILIIFYNL
jgi:hypothetical protein